MRVLVDFNEVYDDNFIWAVRDRSNFGPFERLALNDWVELYDYDGTSCLGRVIALTDQTVDCEIDWETVEYITSEIPSFDPLFVGPVEPVSYLTPSIA